DRGAPGLQEQDHHQHDQRDTGLMFNAVPRGFIPTQDKLYLIAGVKLPEGSSLERTDAVLQRMKDLALGTDGRPGSRRQPFCREEFSDLHPVVPQPRADLAPSLNARAWPWDVRKDQL